MGINASEGITLRGIKRGYPSLGEPFWALKGIDIDIRPSTLTILRGRSGSGKTTLMNIMSTLDTPTSGQVLYGSKDITKLSASECDKLRREEIGFIFQSVALIPMLNAYENVEFRLRMASRDKKGFAQRTEECLRLVGLSQRGKHMPQEMSGGEQQRIAIARAIAHRPSIVFADEPTAELDSKTALVVAKILRDLVEIEKMTIIMSTHDAGMIGIADTVYYLEDGEITNEY
jgi:putative ABC transport system ATP-binding protein